MNPNDSTQNLTHTKDNLHILSVFKFNQEFWSGQSYETMD